MARATPPNSASVRLRYSSRTDAESQRPAAADRNPPSGSSWANILDIPTNYKNPVPGKVPLSSDPSIELSCGGPIAAAI